MGDHKTVSVIIGTDWYLPDDYRRSFDLKYAVDTFCYGMFLFDLVTGKSPSVKDPKTTSTRKLLPSGKVTRNDNGIPVIPSILNSVPSASGIPNIVATGGDIPDIVCGPI